MILRLTHLAFRLIGSFFFVFFLQIQFDGKSLETYLNNFGRKFVVTRSLQKVSEDSVKVIRSFSAEEKKTKEEISRLPSSKEVQKFFDRFTFPEESFPEERKRNKK